MFVFFCLFVSCVHACSWGIANSRRHSAVHRDYLSRSKGRTPFHTPSGVFDSSGPTECRLGAQGTCKVLHAARSNQQSSYNPSTTRPAAPTMARHPAPGTPLPLRWQLRLHYSLRTRVVREAGSDAVLGLSPAEGGRLGNDQVALPGCPLSPSVMATHADRKASAPPPPQARRVLLRPPGGHPLAEERRRWSAVVVVGKKQIKKAHTANNKDINMKNTSFADRCHTTMVAVCFLL